MIEFILEWGIPIILTPPLMWVFWSVAKANERQETYRSLMNAYQRAKERGDHEEAKRLFEVAHRDGA